MIQEQYVSFEVAKLLKEKGFNESCNRVYKGPNLKYTTLDISPLMSLGELGGFHPRQLYVTNNELGDIVYTAPTQQMAMRWLRELYQIDIQVFRHIRGKRITFYARIEQNTHLEHQDKCNLYQSYEQACEAAIKYSLENLI